MNQITQKKIVCLGGGIGTVNLIKGLTECSEQITAIVSMADSGGSSGRLRRLYHIPPCGDLISCMSASIRNNDLVTKLLTYRFPGNRYDKDDLLAGQRLGNLIMVALRDSLGSFDKAVEKFKEMFGIKGDFLPATVDLVDISVKTIEGKEIFGEEKIDLGKYKGKRILDKLSLHPKNPEVSEKVIEAILKADCVIAGPGDLYTTILPVLIVPQILKAVKNSKSKKIFVVNVANKPFETKGYVLSDFIDAIEKHLHCFPFELIVANNNFKTKIPKAYKYKYVKINTIKNKVLSEDLVYENFPLYHDSEKLAKVIIKNI